MKETFQSVSKLDLIMASQPRVLFSSPKNQKLFKILSHIKSYGSCM